MGNKLNRAQKAISTRFRREDDTNNNVGKKNDSDSHNKETSLIPKVKIPPNSRHPIIGARGRIKLRKIVTFWFRECERNINPSLILPIDIVHEISRFYPTIQSSILICDEDKQILEFIEKTYDQKLPHIYLERLYRASKDGYKTRDFHSKCDGKGATITVIESVAGHVFGGFTSVSWVGASPNFKFVNDPTAFLFLIRTEVDPKRRQRIADKRPIEENSPLNGIYKYRGVKLPLRFAIEQKSANNAVCHYIDFGPRFGGGADIHLVSPCNTSNSNYSDFGVTFQYPPEFKDYKREVLAGGYHFKVAEMEVFSVVDLM